MPRKTAAQKPRTAAATASTDTANNQAPAQYKLERPDVQPRQKKLKTNHGQNVTPNGAESRERPSEVSSTLPTVGRQPGHVRPPPPPQPKSVASKMSILPREVDDARLRARHEMYSIAIMPNSKMESKIQQILQAMQAPVEHGKSTVVALTASARAANKCVGVVEIAKREFSKVQSAKVYQYTGCWMRLETEEPRQQVCKDIASGNLDRADGQAQDDEDDASEDVFEDHVKDDRRRVRNGTCLVIYLSTKPVARLREIYGEQIYSLDKG